MKIENFELDEKSPSFIIAEGGVNHNGDVELAKKLCISAKNSHADAIKFQTWKTDELITSDVKTANYQKNTTQIEFQYSMLKNLELSYDEFKEISEFCKKIGILFLSTPGDKESADFLNRLKIPTFKIGSDDLDNLPLLKHVAQMKKPLILSTGMSTMNEVIETFNFVKNFNNEIIFLHCTSNYPAQINEVNLNSLITMKNNLRTMVGYSDHTTSLFVPSIAVCLGAKIIEKHFTLDKNLDGPDHRSSLNKTEFSQMVKNIRLVEEELKHTPIEKNKISNLMVKLGLKDIKTIELALGSLEKNPTETEKQIIPFVRKTIVAVKPLTKGQRIMESDLAVKRTGKFGISPRLFFDIINKNTTIDIEKNEIIDDGKIA